MASVTRIPAGGAAAPSYFVDQRKGEVNELKTLLQSASAARDPKRKRDLIKKVIAYMTLGLDVSRLFTEMMMAIETRDIVVKKMVYHYLSTYAVEKPDMAIMAINTMQRDCANEDPFIRGLALRALCNLKLPSVLEYVLDPLQRGLRDPNSYVRKTAVMGILKLRHVDASLVDNSSMVDTLYDMLRDPDAQVVGNCIVVLNELLMEDGGMAINQAIILHLLNRVSDFNEWSMCQVLDLVARYDPTDDEETFSIMNLLDPLLRTSNSGVVLACIKCFVHLTGGMPDLHWQVYERFKAPLLTLMAGGSAEVSFCILKHVRTLVHRCPGIFDPEYRQFYARFNEPTSTKFIKVEILAAIAADGSLPDIVGELAEMVGDANAEMARRSIRAIAKIGLRLPDGVGAVFERMLDFLDLEVDYVQAEAAKAMRDLLRKHPERRRDVLPTLCKVLRSITEPEGRAAIVWIVGEFGAETKEAPYVLEPLIDGYGDLSDTPDLRLQLLTASMKLFFRRPPELQSMLGRLLAAAVEDTSNHDVHDRALLYYRLLLHGAEAAEKTIMGDNRTEALMSFYEDADETVMDKIFSEFNTLSTLYSKSSDQFIKEEFRPGRRPVGDPNGGILGVSRADAFSASPAAAVNMPTAPAGPAPGSAPVTATYGDATEDLLGFGGGGDGGGGGAPPSPAVDPAVDLAMAPPAPQPASAAAPPEDDSISLSEAPSMDSGAFQRLWTELPEVMTNAVRLPALPATPQYVENALQSLYIYTMASGDLPDAMKFFLYGQNARQPGQYILAQALLKKETPVDMTIILKSNFAGAEMACIQFLTLVSAILG